MPALIVLTKSNTSRSKEILPEKHVAVENFFGFFSRANYFKLFSKSNGKSFYYNVGVAENLAHVVFSKILLSEGNHDCTPVLVFSSIKASVFKED